MSTLEAKTRETPVPLPMSEKEFLALPFWRQLELAHQDLIALSKTPGYIPNLIVYYSRSEDIGRVYGVKVREGCHVCLAGSALARTLKQEPLPFDSGLPQLRGLSPRMAEVMQRISTEAIQAGSSYLFNSEGWHRAIRDRIRALRKTGK